jgi:NAD(P)-dependent dehydrogenase (short-subunit alcohol dehydrogenase family)
MKAKRKTIDSRRWRVEKFETFGSDTPMGRPGQPAELASIYVQLADPQASYAIGQVYGAAGGGGQP